MTIIKPTALCLMGPTASGKTDLALALVQDLPLEIINVDSTQIYRGMDIGTSKPERKILESVPHHLIDIRCPSAHYSVAQFCDDAKRIMLDIIQRNKIPILVGGTMMYFKALQQGLSCLPASDKSLRAELENCAKQQGWQYLYQRLQTIDPGVGNRINANDKQRILRSLEVYEMTGKPMSFWMSQPKSGANAFEFINLALFPIETQRSLLHERIALRFETMLEQGLIEEVRKLYISENMNMALPAFRAVGYRQIWQFLSNQFSFDQMKEQAIAATRQLAKRQMTWLRHWQDLFLIDYLHPQLEEKVKNHLFSNFRR